MTKEKEEGKDEKKLEKKLEQTADASIDFPVEVEALVADPYHETGAIFHAGKKKAAELVKRGWVKMVSVVALIMLASVSINAQTSVIASLYNATNTYSLAKLQAATAVQDTVTDTGVGALYSKRISGPGVVTVQVNVQKVSGTVAGTITLYGSIDGINYSAANTEETQTALATKALANTAGTVAYHWRLKDSPYLYYQIGTAGGTTCVYYLTASILKH